VHLLLAIKEEWNQRFDWLVAHGAAPGFAAIVLGFWAGGFAFFTERIEKLAHKRLWKATFIVIFLLLSAAEIGIISADRREQYRKDREGRTNEKIHFDSIMGGFTTTANLLSIQNQNLTNLAKMRIQGSTTIIQAPTSTGNLKERTILLSQKIVELLQNDAQACQTTYGQLLKTADLETRQKITSHCATFTGKTFRFFNGYFDNVVKIRRELADLHVSDPELDRVVEREQQNIALSRAAGHDDNDFPLNLVDIQLIAQALSNLANKLP
jgi:hypothetical protein